MLSCDGQPLGAQDEGGAIGLRQSVPADVPAPAELRSESHRESVEHHQVAVAQNLVNNFGQQPQDTRKDLRRCGLHSGHRRRTESGEDEESRALQLQGNSTHAPRAHGLKVWLLIS